MRFRGHFGQISPHLFLNALLRFATDDIVCAWAAIDSSSRLAHSRGTKGVALLRVLDRYVRYSVNSPDVGCSHLIVRSNS